jgi:hypothetical protein
LFAGVSVNLYTAKAGMQRTAGEAETSPGDESFLDFFASWFGYEVI